MYEIIQKAHSGVAYLALGILIIAVINAFMGISSKRGFEDKDRKISLFALIFCHIQLLLGLTLYIVGSKWQIIGEVMSGEEKYIKVITVEHPFSMILAIVLITIGWSKHKKEESSNGKFKKISIFYALGLLLILSMLPWFYK